MGGTLSHAVQAARLAAPTEDSMITRSSEPEPSNLWNEEPSTCPLAQRFPDRRDLCSAGTLAQAVQAARLAAPTEDTMLTRSSDPDPSEFCDEVGSQTTRSPRKMS